MSSFRQIVLVFVVGLLLITFQTTILQGILPHRIVPNLLLILVVFLGFYQVNVLGVALAFLVGLQLDMASGVLLGPWACSFTIVFALLAFFAQHIFVESALAVAATVAVGSVVSDFIYIILVYEFKPSNSYGTSYSFFSILLTILLSPLLFKLFKRIFTHRAPVWKGGVH